MKTPLILMLCSLMLPAQEAEERVVLVPWTKERKEVPLFFSAAARVKARVDLDEVKGEQEIAFRIHQGRPETLTLSLTGRGEVTEVRGTGLKDWSLRTAEDGARFLELRPAWSGTEVPASLDVVVATRMKVEGGEAELLLPGPGPATGFSLDVELGVDRKAGLKILRAEGLVPVEGGGSRRFTGHGAAALGLGIFPATADARGLEMLDAALEGRVAGDGSGVSFRFTGKARAEGPGAALEWLGGGAAITGGVSGDGWHVALRRKGDGWVHDLVAERAGEIPVEIAFEVAGKQQGDWRVLDFALPAGVVVPVGLEGLGDDVEFDPSRPVVPQAEGGRWRGYLPASGQVSLAWHEADRVAAGSLFFSSTEIRDVRVGSGLLRQRTQLDLRVLQGRLGALALQLEGPGEVLSVAGDSVLGWSVREDAGKRVLDVRLNRPIEGAAGLVLESQAALGAFPVKSEALRMTPVGSLRHSGWLRVANEGAVRVEVADARGLIQLAPAQFPGGVDEALRQVFVYRFPSADYSYAVNASEVRPEVGLSEVTVYEFTETDRRITADLELDIREAPLREWEIEIPADHAVASVSGAEVADYGVASRVVEGRRVLKILFKQAVTDRQLISVSLEKNESAKAGDWVLPPLGFPGVKTRRGYIGALGASGYRLTASGLAGVAEVPVTFFPKKTPGLQQAFRVREDRWSVRLAVEALGQSIQADVFHLYALKTGAVYGSVLVNFFVVGAPASEWRIAVPEGVGNIEVTGQNVGRDWRREGDAVVVPLTRPVLGTGTVLLTFEQPMSAGGGSISPGEVRPLGVQAERGFVQVVSPLQVNHRAVAEGNLLALDAMELPAEFRLLSSAPSLGVWQYTARDFKIGMDIEWFEGGETVAQVVDFQKLSSRISRDGQWVTDARIFVKSRGKEALRMRFPEGAALWEARVDGAAVNARSDGGETLVPLPAKLDPNQAVEVSLRYGAKSGKPGRLLLTAPVIGAPVVIGEWTVAGDEGRRLVPLGGTADLVRPVMEESGWEWLARHVGWLVALLAAAGAALVWGRWFPGVARGVPALVCGSVFVVLCGWLAVKAAASATTAQDLLEYAAPVVASGGRVTIEVANMPVWLARSGWPVWLGFALGTALAVRGVLRGDRWWTACGLALAVSAFLSIRGGAPLFFGVAALAGLFWCLPRGLALVRGRLRPAAKTAAVVAVWMIGTAPWSDADDGLRLRPAESVVQDWVIRDGRLHGTMNIVVRAVAGDRFLLLREPAVLSRFDGAGLNVVKSAPGLPAGYWIEATSAGRLEGRAEFEMPLADPAQGWDPPGGPAALMQVKVRWDQAGWEFAAQGAARIGPLDGLKPGESGAVILLGPEGSGRVCARPMQRNAGDEEPRFFAENTSLFLPGPGVVNGRHAVNIRPTQGRVSGLTMIVPEGFAVSDVVRGPVGAWRFDPERRELRVSVEPAQTEAFGFVIETQRSAAMLPVDLDLEPLRVAACAGEIGFLGVAFGEDVQPESVTPDGLSRVNPGDFQHGLLPVDSEGRPTAVLQHAFRHGAAPANLKLRVAAVAPELRAEWWQWVSLGEDRVVVAADLMVSMTRSGVFALALELPDELEVESATGEGLSHWTEEREQGKRVLTLHLSGRTLGQRSFSITLVGKPTGAVASWQVPRLSLRGASRETGMLTLVPERGLQIRAAKRENVSQLDPRSVMDQPRKSARAAAAPGALAYRLLQGDWTLTMAITRLDPWVTARVFHDATLREGQVSTRVNVAYKIENAAVKSQRVSFPGLDENTAKTLRATGPAVADLLPVDGRPGTYEVRFQRGIAGETEVDFEYQSARASEDSERIAPIVLEGVRQQECVVALRAGGRLELSAGELPRGWQRVDGAVAEASLRRPASAVAPSMAFRVAEADGPLPVVVKRHELANLRKLRVSEGSLTTLLAPTGQALTAVNLKMEVVDKTTLRLRLPADAALFNVFVNDEGATLVREGRDWRFHVAPSPESGRPSVLRFVYSASSQGGRSLKGPELDVPMENLAWRVLVPEGWTLAGHGGDFDLVGQSALGSFRLQDYQDFARDKRSRDARSAVALLDQANAWLEAGDQEKAGLALGSAVNNGLLDEASGEDARVQLRALKTQQAVLGINTRRQKLVLDNRYAASQGDNPQLDRAAQVNPVLRGASNFDPKQFDRFLEGNTADENAALKEIAHRIVAQQLAADPAPAALDVTLPERGTVLHFSRSVQTDGARPMTLDLRLKRSDRGFAWLAIPLCIVIGAMGVAVRRS